MYLLFDYYHKFQSVAGRLIIRYLILHLILFILCFDGVIVWLLFSLFNIILQIVICFKF